MALSGASHVRSIASGRVANRKGSPSRVLRAWRGTPCTEQVTPEYLSGKFESNGVNLRRWIESLASRAYEAFVVAAAWVKFVGHEGSVITEFRELSGALPGVSAEWDPFSVHLIDQTPLYAHGAFRDYALGVYMAGRHFVRRLIGANVAGGWTDPGTIVLTPPGIDAVWEASGSSRAAVIMIRPAFLSRAIEENWDVDSKNVGIIRQFLIRDPVIDALTLNLAREAAHRSPAGRLYAESACEFLAHHLIHHYSTLSATPPRSIGGLPGRRLKLVLEYIEDTLGHPIELRYLASLAGVSIRHFERAFRQSMGIPPHAYVLRRRLDTARDLLINRPELPTEHIALRLGFCSSSHLSSAFRRRIGCSPTEFRRRHARG
jgi:AraC family transcriptional regulator